MRRDGFRCALCGADDAPWACSHCPKVRYCNMECSIAHWRRGGGFASTLGAAEEPHKERCERTLARRKKRRHKGGGGSGGNSSGAGARHKDVCPRTHTEAAEEEDEPPKHDLGPSSASMGGQPRGEAGAGGSAGLSRLATFFARGPQIRADDTTSDSQIIKRIHQILNNADLEKTTVSSLRNQPEVDLNITLSNRKQFVPDEVSARQDKTPSIGRPSASTPGQLVFCYSAPIQRLLFCNDELTGATRFLPRSQQIEKYLKSGAQHKKAEEEDEEEAEENEPPKPKRAYVPYMLFCKEQRPKIVATNLNLTFGYIGKALGAA
jgi:hypothetical protein